MLMQFIQGVLNLLYIFLPWLEYSTWSQLAEKNWQSNEEVLCVVFLRAWKPVSVVI